MQESHSASPMSVSCGEMGLAPQVIHALLVASDPIRSRRTVCPRRRGQRRVWLIMHDPCVLAGLWQARNHSLGTRGPHIATWVHFKTLLGLVES